MELKKFEDLQQAQLTVSFGSQRIFISVFFIDGLLIDTGPSKKRTELIPLFDQWKMEQVILTHHHEDHTGMASWIQRHEKIPIYLHEAGIPGCEKKMKLPFYRKVFWGERKPYLASPLGDAHQTPRYEWEIIHTPGHADDHVALLNKEKGWLFGGDLYVQSSPKSSFAFESIPGIIQSLNKILSYDFDTYICSHAGVLQHGRHAIEKKLDYLTGIQQEVLHLAARGMTNLEIRKRLFPKHHPMHYLSFFENSPMHIVNSILK
ncbi:MBL fold metallo-hydrolase [Sporosarcina sp. 179-K 3D1 HS]|uniref:MBL fold metallo-hydrolase n=1 Tax=Sporosarcina sp. 179-K 3D1 HS TaxID=3232169 RepID=UPI00399F40ED